ncbi:MAG: apolipoprotein N-acyltransferase [Bacteroidota bacterium]|nr:apolipoprotein N-acyltransferase [Bacteroidota bacterium]
MERLDSYFQKFRFLYLTFFIASCVALYWVGGFTHMRDPYLMMAGGLLLLAEPVFFSLIMLTYSFIRRKLGLTIALIALPAVWVTWEWLYAYGQFSFPWLTLGDTQTYYLQKIQFAEITGVYGISLWIVIINVLVFMLFLEAAKLGWKVTQRRSVLLIAAIAVLYITPTVYSFTVNENKFMRPSHNEVNIGIVQPNTDPWEKWTGENSLEGRWNQVKQFLSMTNAQRKDSIQISVWPETAVLFNLPSSRYYNDFRSAIDSMNVSIITGFVDYRFYENGEAPVGSSVIPGTSVRYDSYNSIMFAEPRVPFVQKYAKMRLVPFAERIPYAEKAPFLIEPLRWGVGISNWGIGKDSTVFEDHLHNSKFLAMVCYESIFPEFVSTFVKRGAQFLVFITNDSWWGNTSGARQHAQIAVLRAVENRRWVVRCANGGISCFIDPMGRMYDNTAMYTQASIVHRIEPRTEQTFYTRHGDWFARVCAVLALVAFVTAVAEGLWFKVKGSRVEGKTS